MRNLPIKSVLCCALCVAAGTSFGQSGTYGAPGTDSDSDRSEVRSSDYSTDSDTDKASAESTHFFKSKDLVGADIKDSQGDKIGGISELVVNHQTGETFASVAVKNDRFALVPIQAFQVERPAGMIRNAVVTLNSSKQELESGPTIAKDEWNRLDSPSFVKNIYSHYDVQQPSAMGGSDDLEGTGSSSMKLHKSHDKMHCDHGDKSAE